MKVFSVLALVNYALAARVNTNKRASPLEVKVETVGNSAVKASITNTGDEELKLLKTGTVLDSLAVEKAEIYSAGGCKYPSCRPRSRVSAAVSTSSTSSRVSALNWHHRYMTRACANRDNEPADQVVFDGLRLSVQNTNISENAFQTLKAGETVDVEWDPAEVHDLSTGGDFDFVVRGSFLTAEPGTTDITGAVSYDSGAVANHVDGAAAAKVRRDWQENIRRRLKRTDVATDCTGARGQAQLKALQNCQSISAAAAEAALNGSAAKMNEYFKSSTQATRSTVAGVFKAIAEECGSTTSGISDQYCTDQLGYCEPADSVLAYTLPSQNVMVSCPLYFNELPDLESRCHGQDQATTTLHEATHLRQIRGTNDYGYGYSAIQQLTTRQALDNADTYTLFANGMSAPREKCSVTQFEDTVLTCCSPS